MPKIFNLNGKVRDVNISDYIVDWERVVSKPQKTVKDFLRKYWKTDIVLEEFRIPNSLMRIDILNFSKKIAVEVSPSSSHSFNPFFHQNSPAKFLASLKRDIKKKDFCVLNGYTLVEVFDEDFPLTKNFFKDKYDIDL